MAASDDAELVRRSCAGDRTAFRELYERHRRRVFSFSYRLTMSRETAEDVMQSTFLKAFQSISTLDDRRVFPYWLLSIARNEALGWFRQRRKAGTQTSIENEEVWDDDTPHEQVVHQELRDHVHHALAMLKPEYREVLILRQFDDLSYAEIAAVTGDSLSAVESRLFKARKALAKVLAPYMK